VIILFFVDSQIQKGLAFLTLALAASPLCLPSFFILFWIVPISMYPFAIFVRMQSEVLGSAEVHRPIQHAAWTSIFRHGHGEFRHMWLMIQIAEFHCSWAAGS